MVVLSNQRSNVSYKAWILRKKNRLYRFYKIEILQKIKKRLVSLLRILVNLKNIAKKYNGEIWQTTYQKKQKFKFKILFSLFVKKIQTAIKIKKMFDQYITHLTCFNQDISQIFTLSIFMHSASSRFNSVTITTGITLAIMCLFNFFHNYYMYDPQPIINFQIKQINLFKQRPKHDELSFKFDLDADLSSVYNWNLKQVYVYIEASWNDPITNITSQAIVYDWIISTPNNRDLVPSAYKKTITNAKLDYNVRDVYHGLKGNNLNITINIQYMPYVGFFFKTKLHETTLKLPQVITK